ncbi:MAG: hypothetical protein AB8G14_10545 [Ilumatobacter sp.]
MADIVFDTIERLVKPTQQFVRGWMLTSDTAAHGTSIGFATGTDFWIVGRAGVLGECTAETAIAGLAFHAPDIITRAWHGVPAAMTHLEVAYTYAQLAIRWGESELARFDSDRLERLDDYGRRIIDAAPSSLGSIFAGWRNVPVPESVEGRVALTGHVLREMRGAAHIAAITTVGLTPLDAILASTNAPPRTGPKYAERMGFVGPFRDPDEIREQRLEADVITSKILTPYFDVLDADELADFADVFESTRNAIDM